MRILLIAEHDNARLKDESLKTLTAALQIGDHIDVLVMGYQCQQAAEMAARLGGVKLVMWVDDPALQYKIPENASVLVSELAKDYTHVLCSSSIFGKNILPRVAAVLNVAQISNVSEIVSPEIYIRPIYSGNVLVKVKSHDSIKIITLMASAFDSIVLTQEAVGIKQLQVTVEPNISLFKTEKTNKSERPPLQSAEVVIAGGRGLKSAKNFQYLDVLADKLNAAIAATRAIVDLGWASNDQQVGQTGKTIAPRLYLALGISGAAQHLAGIRDSRIIVAINNDPHAPIFDIADYGLVADLNEVLPKLNALL